MATSGQWSIVLIDLRKFRFARSTNRTMARGHQKIQSQQKAQKKAQDAKKAQGSDQKAAAQKALNVKCTVCMALMPDLKTYKQHFENKHPKATMPTELAEAAV
ncbi:hypothetical protein WR25_02035 [Diploscapter pachys]|uniref:Small EDRK-rich factor-like N-terminal domain-containing protein n=1 Tax=Diploscapter pachys TaxID=2018661 RepID=A0A2A2K9H3_9BILA|nr:hypothetical protein WR25_02035 [Diploscapter pachys]